MKKSWSGALAVLLVSMSALAHAQGVPGAADAQATPASATATTTAATPAPAWNNDGDAHITRAQVYHELVQAQNDGELKTLNSTLYAHH